MVEPAGATSLPSVAVPPRPSVVKKSVTAPEDADDGIIPHTPLPWSDMNDLEERVILVDEHDNPIGVGDKLPTHERGDLHRAFSVFLINRAGEILLQQRATTKYHGGGKWANSACGHPRPGEETVAAARRRLQEEMGIEAELEPVFAFTYRAAMDGGLIEHEIDHVMMGYTDETPQPDPTEVAGWRWLSPDAIRGELATAPDRYTPWFEPALEGLLDRIPSILALSSRR